MSKLITWLKTFCWHCGWNSNEWFNLRGFIERHGKCFYCRIDKLDEIYGPSLTAELVRQQSKNKQYKYSTRPSRWNIR